MWDLTLNIVRDSEKRKILGDLTATLVAGFAKLLARDVVLGKKLVFGIEVTEVRGVGLSLKRDQTPPPPPSTLPDPVPMAGVSFKARSGQIYFMADKLQHAVSKLRYKGSSKRGGRLREVVARGVRV